MNFQKDLEEKMTIFNEIVNASKESRRLKLLEEIPSIDNFVNQIMVNVRALKTNIETFNNKEKEKIEMRKNLSDLIMMQHGVQG